MIFERSGRALGRVVLAHRWATVALSVLVFTVFALGLPRAKFSTDYRVFFSSDDPGLSAFEQLERVFTKTDNVLFVVKAREGSVFATDALEATQELTAAGWKLPHASRVDSLTNYQHPMVVGDDIAQGELVAKPARSLSANEIATARAAAIDEPLLVGGLLSRDERAAGVNVTLRLPSDQADAVTETAEAARGVVAAVAARHPSVEIRASGMAFMNDAFMKASVRDMAVIIPLMVVVMLAAMAILLRSVTATLGVGAIISLSAAASMAFAGWLRYPLTPPAVAAPMIVLTVAVADGVHVVLAALDGMRAGARRDEALIDAMAANLEAITYTWLTTIVGFVCLNYSEAPPVRHLANMTCFGVTVAFVLSFTLLPALLSLGRVEARPLPARRPSAIMPRLADFVVRRRGVVAAACAVITIAGAYGASGLEANDQFVRYFDTSLPFRRDAEFTMRNLSGIYRLEYQVGSTGPGGVVEPAYLERLDAFGGWLRAQPEVEHVYSVADIIKRVNRVVSGDDPAGYRVPATREAASQSLLLYEMSLPSGLDLTDRVNVDRSSARLTATVKDMSTREMTDFAHRSEGWLRANAPTSMWAEATGPVIIFSRLGDRNARSMVRGDFVSLALISLCMIIVLRSVRLGLLSVIPNVIPIVVGYGIWRLVVGHMNIVATIAGSISLGIIVDDTIHFLTKYQALRRARGASSEAAMRETLAHVGPAMISTSAILVLGFGVLTLSSFQMTSHLGWLSVIIVGLAPIADLLLAPALVLMLSRDRAPETEPAGTSSLQTEAS